MTLKLEDYPVLKSNQIGGTTCSSSVIHYWSGIATESMVYFNKDLKDQVRVKNELIKNYVRGVLVNMVARATPS
jgi:hypothetical protein